MRSLQQILADLATSPESGLKPDAIAGSRAKFGANRLTPLPRQPLWRKFLEKFDEPIIKILLAAALLSIVVDLFNGNIALGATAFAVMVVVVLATGVAFLSEYKSDREFEVLNARKDEIHVKVTRGGDFHTVALDEVVVGDLLTLETGDEIPADGRI